jgi:hypothetical protein
MHWIEGCWLQRVRDKGHGAGDTGLAMDFSSAEIIRWKFSVVQEIRQQKSALRCCVINYGLKSAARMTYFALMEASSEKSQTGLSEHSRHFKNTALQQTKLFSHLQRLTHNSQPTTQKQLSMNHSGAKKKKYPFGYLHSLSLTVKILPAMQSLGGLKHGSGERRKTENWDLAGST